MVKQHYVVFVHDEYVVCTHISEYKGKHLAKGAFFVLKNMDVVFYRYI